MEALVIRSTGSDYVVLPLVAGHIQEENPIPCKLKGNLRLRGLRSTSPVVVGDHVEVELTEGETAFITDIKDRRNHIARKSINLSKHTHILAANVDASILVVTLYRPQTSTTFIDRFLASSEAYNVPVILVFNKIDQLNETEQRELDAFIMQYQSIGYTCVCVSALQGTGLSELMPHMTGKISLLSGHSGVGKSTLLNQLIPTAQQKTSAISEVHNSGLHTTTLSEMFALPQGGYLIDTPGIKGFGTFDFADGEVGHYFPEMFRIARDCRFRNCTHRDEPGCAVLRALDEGRLAASRYASYLSILSDNTASRYR